MIGGPKALYKKVRYPEMAEKAGVEGLAQIVFTVGKTGVPRDFEVRGEKPKGLGFADAAIAALGQMRFEPGYQRDKAVPVRMSQTVKFTVD
jgi:protein TonB